MPSAPIGLEELREPAFAAGDRWRVQATITEAKRRGHDEQRALVGLNLRELRQATP
jgi:hypothetical protein